jgi:pimeloyl-ACP methyl ester carboxylesterase
MGGDGRPSGGRAGTGVPALLITGAAMAAAARLRTLPVLAERFRASTMHAGLAPGGPRQAVARLAEEAVARLDAAGAVRAHPYGPSFGGMIVQELALGHHDRIQSLVLAATTQAGGSASLRTSRSAISLSAVLTPIPPERPNRLVA